MEGHGKSAFKAFVDSVRAIFFRLYALSLNYRVQLDFTSSDLIVAWTFVVVARS